MMAQSVCQCQWQPLSFHSARPRFPPPSLPLPLPRSFSSPQFSVSIPFPQKSTTSRRHCRSSSSNNNPKFNEENSFFDEDGVVKDMDGYLNYLSLEYESVWDTKPSWCQPWTITLTGVLIIASSWLLLHSTIVTAVVLTLICTWWYIFLYSYPKEYSDMIAERRKKVSSGLEDTYGVRQSNEL